MRYSVGLFVFALVFAVMALNRPGEFVPQLIALVTAILGIACIADFLFLIDYAARLLRPVSVVAHVGDDGVAVIQEVYPVGSGDVMAPSAPLRETLGAPAGSSRTSASRGSCLRSIFPSLVALARAMTA